MIEVRAPSADDVERIVAIYVESWNQGFGALMPEIRADAERMLRWQADLAEPLPVRWAVADQDERIVGFIGARPSRDPVDPTLGEIDTIAVAPEAWRTGVGRALMGWALDCLRSDGYRLAILWTLAHYPRGAGFYAALGWRLNGATRRSGTQVRYDHDLRAGMAHGDA